MRPVIGPGLPEGYMRREIEVGRPERILDRLVIFSLESGPSQVIPMISLVNDPFFQRFRILS